MSRAKGQWGIKIALGIAMLATTMGVVAQGSSTLNVISAGGFEGTPAALAWDQYSSKCDVPIQQVGKTQAHGGSWIARLGGIPKATYTLEQGVGALGAYTQSATLSFYWQVENPMPGRDSDDVLYVDLEDANSGQIIPLATLADEGVSGWQLFSLPISPYNLGLRADKDYILHFESVIRSAKRPTTFDLDDVLLVIGPTSNPQGPVAQMLPIDPDTDPVELPPVADVDGDMQDMNSPQRDVIVVGTSVYGHNRELPNTCSPPFTTHQQITLTATGFTGEC